VLPQEELTAIESEQMRLPMPATATRNKGNHTLTNEGMRTAVTHMRKDEGAGARNALN